MPVVTLNFGEDDDGASLAVALAPTAASIWRMTGLATYWDLSERSSANMAESVVASVTVLLHDLMDISQVCSPGGIIVQSTVF